MDEVQQLIVRLHRNLGPDDFIEANLQRHEAAKALAVTMARAEKAEAAIEAAIRVKVSEFDYRRDREAYGVRAWLRELWCVWAHGGGEIKHDSLGRLNWQCRCGRWSNHPLPPLS